MVDSTIFKYEIPNYDLSLSLSFILYFININYNFPSKWILKNLAITMSIFIHSKSSINGLHIMTNFSLVEGNYPFSTKVAAFKDMSLFEILKKWKRGWQPLKIFLEKLMLELCGLECQPKKISNLNLNKDSWFLILIWMTMMMWELAAKGKQLVFYVGNYCW